MKKLLAVLLISCLPAIALHAQFKLEAGAGITAVGYVSAETSSCTPYLGIILSPSYSFNEKWSVDATASWALAIGNNPLKFRNVLLFISASRSWAKEKFTFDLNAGPVFRYRYCMVGTEPLSLIQTIKIGLGIEPGVSFRISERSQIRCSSLLEAHLYDPLSAYYTLGLPKKFMWSAGLNIGIVTTFSRKKS